MYVVHQEGVMALELAAGPALADRAMVRMAGAVTAAALVIMAAGAWVSHSLKRSEHCTMC